MNIRTERELRNGSAAPAMCRALSLLTPTERRMVKRIKRRRLPRAILMWPVTGLAVLLVWALLALSTLICYVFGRRA